MRGFCSDQASERLALLGIIGDAFEVPLKSHAYPVKMITRGLRGLLSSNKNCSSKLNSQDSYRLTFSYISFLSFTFPGASHRRFPLLLPWLHCHFYLVVNKQQQLKVTSPPWRFLSYLLLTLLLYFIFYLPQCILHDFPSVFSQASLPFFSCCNRAKTANTNPIHTHKNS